MNDQNQTQPPPPPPPPPPPTSTTPPHALLHGSLEHLRFVVHLQKRFTNEIGYIGQEASRWYLEHQGVVIAQENDEPAGFLLFKPHAPTMPAIVPIFQAAIAYDARRRHHGLRLVEHVKRTAMAANKRLVQLWCRCELEANDFWKAAGFVAVAARPGGRGRKIPHVLWRFPTMDADDCTAIAAPPSRGPAGRAVFAATTEELAALNDCAAAKLRSAAESILKKANRPLFTAGSQQPGTAETLRPTASQQPTLF
jgi:hypothetical protein